MKVQAAFLRSRLARRILVLFFFCALLPSATVAVLAFREVGEQFDLQNERRLHQASKSLGLYVYQKLLFLESELLAVGGSAGFAAERSAALAWLQNRLDAITVVHPDGSQISVLGKSMSPPLLDDGQRKHLREGGTVVAVGTGSGKPRVYLARLVHPHEPDAGTVFWRANDEYLWSTPDAHSFGPGSDICIVDHRSAIIHCVGERSLSYPPAMKAEISNSASGVARWDSDDSPVVAAYWTIFLRARFGSPKWTMIVSRAPGYGGRSVASFRRTFPLVIAGALCLVLLLSINQIRRSLGPLDALQRGTARIAQGEFDTRVTVISGDEFEELAESFNGMAARLGQQFRALATMAEIDRAVLSVIDRERIVQTLLTRIPDLYPCSAVSVSLLDSDVKGACQTWIRRADAEASERKERCSVSEEDMDELRAHPESLFVTGDDDLPDYLSPLHAEEISSYVVFPILAASDLLGIISLGLASDDAGSPEERLQIRRLGDQVGIALLNVRMFEQVRLLAYYDSLTGLPNRVQFQDQVTRALEKSKQDDKPFAIFLLDLDDFKRINDTLGHQMGDELLQAVAGRVMESLRQGDALARLSEQESVADVARLGGDEFTVLLTGIEGPQDAARVASRIVSAFERGILLGSREVFVTPSIGIAVAPLDGEDADTLLKNADTAMYHAKEEGRNNFQFYRESMSAVALHRLNLENRLRGALDRNEFVVHYQPILDVTTGVIVGVEALARWSDPEVGIVSPDDFIPIAEETSLIIQIGEWVLREACAQTRRWEEEGLAPIRVAVNFSARQFLDQSLVARVYQALRETMLEPSRLVLELTESILMESARERDVLDELRAIGLRIAIDDFGTGYSSLGYLTQFPLDSIKIDRSFIAGIDKNPGGIAIISAIVAMARSLGLKVVAEGVETLEELAVVRQQGCEEIQGYVFSEAVPGDVIARFLREDRRLGS